MATLNELAYQAYSTNSGTTGTLNEVTYAYLSQVTGLTGVKLNEQWAAALAANGFATGSVNERQMAYWASLGYSGNWNERYYQWLSDGGAFGPNVLINALGVQPTEGYCEYAPAGNCTATRQYQAVTNGFDSPITSYVWSVESGDATITLGQGTDTVTVQTGAVGGLDADQAFVLKCVASNLDPESAEREKSFTHYHRAELTVASIQENTNLGCDYDSGGEGESSCVSNASYTGSFTGTPTQIEWSLSDIAGGSAFILSGQGEGSCVVQTSGGTPEVSYKLSVEVWSQFQNDQLSGNYAQTKTDEPTPVFVGPDIDLTQLVEDVLMTPFDVSGRFTGETAGNYVLVGTWPTGLSIDANGVLSGTPDGPAANYPNLQFQAGNTNGDTLSNTFTVEVIEGASVVAPVFIGPNIADRDEEVGTPVSFDLRPYFSGSTATYTLETGTLPSGLSLDPSGIITGTPDTGEVQAGLSFTATNAAGSDTTNTFTATVWVNIVFDGPDIGPLTFIKDTPFSLDVSGTFSGTIESYSLGGTWPPGFAIDNAGVITGTATSEAVYAGLSVTASNTKPDSAVSNTFTGTAEEQSGPAFYALTPDPLSYEMMGVLTGTGDLTTTHTSDLYAPDFEGVYREFGANEAVWAGGRTVNNQMKKFASRFNGLSWLLQSGAAVVGRVDGVGPNGEDAYDVDLPTSASLLYYGELGGKPNVLDRSYIISYLVRSKTGNINVRIRQDSTALVITPDIALDDVNWKRISMSFTSTGGAGNCGIIGGSVNSGSIYIIAAQQEDVTGQSDIDTPSEFIAEALLPDISDHSIANWTEDNVTSVDNSGTWELTNVAGGANSLNIQISGLTAGNTYVFASEAFAPSTNTIANTARIIMGPVETSPSSAIAVVDQWKDLAVTFVATGPTTNLYFEVAANSAWGNAGDVAMFREFTCTDITAKTYANQNGNTVLNNVVTEAVGTPLAEVPYLQYYPAAQNDLTYSNDATNWASGTAETALDEVGLTGEPNTASSIFVSTATLLNKTSAFVGTVTVGDIITWVFYIKKTTAAVTWPSLQTHVKNDPVAATQYLTLDTDTGLTYPRAGYASDYISEVIDDGDWWKVLMQRTVAVDNTLATQAGMFPSVGTSVAGTWTATIGGCICGNVETHFNKTIAEVRGLGPVFTTTAAVATDRILYNANGNEGDNDVAWYFEYKPGEDHSDYNISGGHVLGRASVPATNGTGMIKAVNSSGGILQAINPASNVTTVILKDVEYKVGSVRSLVDSQTILVVDGVDGNLAAAPVGTITGLSIMNSTDMLPAKMRNLQRYDITSYAEGVLIINDLMA